MDSLTQVALGAAVSVAVMRRRTAPWKAALWGGVAGTLPDLDVLIDHGDPILNMVLHRAETHALFWLALFSLPLGWLAAWLSGERTLWRRWWLAMALALLTHPLLDAMTVYGTQLALPFSNHPYGLGSVFIIDPLVTLPLLVGVGWALAGRGRAGALRANAIGLGLACAYLAWSAVAQQQVRQVALASLAGQGIVPERVLVTPTPFNTLLWRVVAMDGANYHESFHSLLDPPGPMRFDRFASGRALADELPAHDGVRRLRDFSHGFVRLHEVGPRIVITDLRMGQEPHYVFSFAVAERASAPHPLPQAVPVGGRADIGRALAWLWPRMWGQVLPPPR
jgi:inner membrane protein